MHIIFGILVISYLKKQKQRLRKAKLKGLCNLRRSSVQLRLLLLYGLLEKENDFGTIYIFFTMAFQNLSFSGSFYV